VSLPSGIHRIELPLPFDLGTLNVYLLRRGNGFALIDAGMDTPECFSALRRGVEAAMHTSVEWSRMEELIVSHHHPDYIGLAPRLLGLSGARLRIPAVESEALHLLSDPAAAEQWERGILQDAGVPAPLIEQIELSMGPIRAGFHLLPHDLPAGAGECIQTDAGEFEIVSTPGHSPGHLCLYNRAHRLLFSGDHMLEKISPNIGWHPEVDALGDYLASLRAVSDLEVDLVLPSHGQPFRGSRAWIARAIASHERRCDRLEEALALGPSTPFELTRVLWPRELTPFHLRFAVFETLSHLEHLDRCRGIRKGSLIWRREGNSNRI
jgi:glyoxylase-like metal-dependent hydrolase (beta-lactamase superfamily II)